MCMLHIQSKFILRPPWETSSTLHALHVIYFIVLLKKWKTTECVLLSYVRTKEIAKYESLSHAIYSSSIIQC